MKASNLVPDSGYRSLLLSYPALLCAAVFEFLYYASTNVVDIKFYPDTISYIEAGDRILNGLPDLWRTPVYPLVITLIRGMFGPDVWPYAIIVLQFVVFVSSAVFLENTAARFISQPRTVFWIVAVYLLYPGTIYYCVALLTESFAISGTTILIWCLLRSFPDSPKCSDMVIASVILLLLLFLRPAFLYLIPVVSVYYVLIAIKFRKSALSSLVTAAAGIIVVVSLFAVYKNWVNKHHDINSVSYVSTINNYFLIRYAGIADPKLTDNPQLKKCILSSVPNDGKNYLEVLMECRDIRNSVPPYDFEAYVNEAMKSNPYRMAQAIESRWNDEAVKEPAFGRIYWKLSHIEHFLVPRLSSYAIFLILYTIMALYSWRRMKSPPYVTFLLLMVSGGMLVTAVVGAQSDWSRLITPGTSAFIMLFGLLTTLFSRNSTTIR